MDLKKRPSTKTGFSKNVTRVQLFFFLSSAEISSRVKLLIMLIRSNATQLRNLYIFPFHTSPLKPLLFRSKKCIRYPISNQNKNLQSKNQGSTDREIGRKFQFFCMCSSGPVRNQARRGPGTTGSRPWIPGKTDLMKFVFVKNPGTLY